MNKYGNRKVRSVDGSSFDSSLEMKRWYFLSDMLKEGKIANLRRQVSYELLPRQTKKVLKLTKGGLKVVEKFAEHPVVYIADFVYDKPDGSTVIEDTKGMKTRDYIIKRKLMRYQGRPIREVKKPCEEI